ncbi:DM13 domain-containing protein [Flavobacterium myungsuense]|uniref:DM13 domain-containing protein n=2 Tax=Flavobacterium myungsuense TaxID=651823 RepID=A0ABW3IYR0_9FLAO
MKTIQNACTKIICLMLMSTFLISCSKDDEVVTTPIENTVFKGSFVNSAHPTSGNVTINKEKTKLNFTDFKSDSGPDLDIYLVSNLSNVNEGFINLGDIKGLNGNYIYDLPANTDFTVYKYVVVWCVDFNVNFGYATLVP